MIYQTLTKSQFHDAFHHMGRKDNFSYNGLNALYDYLDEQEEYELDVIGLCCEFTESSITDALKDNGCDDLRELQNTTLVLEVDSDTIIYQNY